MLKRLWGERTLPHMHLASFLLWPAIFALYFLIGRRLIGARPAAFACACVAALAAWAGTLMWVAGVQELAARQR